MNWLVVLAILTTQTHALEFDANPPRQFQLHSVEILDRNDLKEVYGFDETGRLRLRVARYDGRQSVDLWTSDSHLAAELSSEDYEVLRRQLSMLRANRRPNVAQSDDAEALVSACPARIEFDELGMRSDTPYHGVTIRAIRQACREN